MKLIDILVMISKGELKEGTKIKYNGTIYKCKDGNVFDPKSGVGLLEYIYEENLNDELELIKPNHSPDIGKMATEKIEELDTDSTTWNDLYIEQKLDILFEKQNEVIRRLNNEQS